MPTVLDTLILEVDLDPAKYAEKIARLRADAMASAKEIEGSFKTVSATLTAKVDDAALTALNKHLDLKQRHFEQVQRAFNQKPLKPRVDFTDLDRLESRINRLNRRSPSVGVSVSGGNSAGNTQQLADAIGRAVARHSRPGVASMVGRAIGAPLSIAGKVAGGIAGNVAGGLAFGATQEVSKNFGQGLSRAIERSLSGVVGSSGLAAEKMTDALLKEIASTFSKKIPSVLQQSLKDAIETGIGTGDILREGLATRRAIDQRTKRQTQPARDQATDERREALRRVQALRVSSDRLDAELSGNREAQSRGMNLEQGLREERQGATGDRANQLDAALKITSQQLLALAEDEQTLIDEHVRIGQELKKATQEIEKTKAAVETLRPEDLPKTYRDILQAIGGKGAAQKAPKLVVSDRELKNKGAIAMYGSESNTIKITSELSDAIEQGQLSYQQLITLAEEVAHAFDFDFGSTKGIDSRRLNESMNLRDVATEREKKFLQPELALYSPEQRQFEQNAKVQALRLTESLATNPGRSRIQSLLGNGGEKLLNVVSPQVSSIQKSLDTMAQLAEKLGLRVGDRLGEFEANLSGIESEFERMLQVDPASLDALGVEEVKSAIGEQFDELTKLMEAVNEYKAEFLVQAKKANEAKVVKAEVVHDKKSIQERIGDVIHSPQMQAAGKAAAGTIHGITTLGKVAFKSAQIIEGFALDLVPMGRTAKAIAQQAVLPAVTFTAATHLLPGGQAAAHTLTQMAAGGLSPLAHGAQGALSEAAGAALQGLPGAFGLKAAVSGMVQEAIQLGISAGTNAIAAAGTAIVGGKALQKAASAPLQLMSAPLPQLSAPEKEAILLPAGRDEPGAITVASGSGKALHTPTTPPSKKMNEAAYKAGESARAIAEAAGTTATDLIASAKKLERGIAGAYAQMKEAIESGNVDAVAGIEAMMQEAKDGALQQINDLIEFAKDNGSVQFGAEDLTKLGGMKGIVTQHFKRAQRAAQNFRKAQEDEIESSRINFEAITKFLQSDQGKAIAKDLMVNTAGFALSQVGQAHGIIPALGGDLVGALAARQAIHVGGAGVEAYREVSQTDAFRQGHAADKLSLIMARLVQKLSEVEDKLGGELSADLMGFSVGNAVGTATGIPFSGAGVAAMAVPQLRSLQTRIQGKLAEPDPGDELESAKLLEMGTVSTRGVTGAARKELEEINKIIAEALAASDDFDSAFKQADKEGANRFQKSAKALAEISTQLVNGELSVKDFGKSLMGMVGTALNIGAAIAVVSLLGPALGDLAKTSLDAAMEMQTLERTVMFASGSFEAGRKNLSNLRKEANQLGVDLRNSMEGFASFANATRDTPLEGAATDQINKALQEGAAVSQLTGQQVDRLYKTFRDIAGKGQVYSEELVGQLAEVGGVFSGGLQIAARSYGVTSQQLRKRMQRGEIKSEDFLPRFAQQLSAETAMSVEGAADSAQASVNRFNNAIFETQAALGKQLLPVQSLGLDLLTKALTATMAVLPGVIQLLGSAGVAAIVKFAVSMNLAGGATLGFSAIVEGSKKALQSFIGLMKTSANSTIGLTAGIFGIIEVLRIFKTAQESMKSPIREFSDAANSGLEKYLELIGKAIDETKRLKNEQKAPSNLETTFVGGLVQGVLGDVGTQFLRRTETAAQRSIGNLANNGNNQNTLIPRLLEAGAGQNLAANLAMRGLRWADRRGIIQAGATRADQEGNAALIDSRESRSTINRTLGEAYAQMGRGGPQEQLAQLLEIDRQIQQVRDRRGALSSDDDKQRRELLRQEQDLLEKRAQASAPIAALQGEMAKYVEGLKASQEIIQSILDRGNLQPEVKAGLERELAAVGETLESVESAQESFNKAMSEGVTINQQLARSFDRITDAIADANQKLGIQDAGNRQRLATYQAMNNLTPGQLQGAQNANTLASGGARINSNQQMMAELRSLIDSPAIQDALSAAGLSNDSGTAEIRRRVEQIGEGVTTETRDRLTMAADNIDRLRGLELETANLAADVSETQAQAAQQMRDLNREIRDYFREVQRTAEDLAQVTKQTNFQSEMQDARSRITRALGDYSDNFFGGIIDALDSALQSLFKIPENFINLTAELAQIGRTLEDGERSIRDMANQGEVRPDGTTGGSGGSGGFFSPLRGASIQQLVSYQESADQGWRAYRDRRNGPDVHAGIDFDSRVGGTPGAEVVAMEGGQATISQIGTVRGSGEGSMQIRIRFTDEQGRPIEYQYNHLSEAAVRQALGTTTGTVPVNAGQVIGRVANRDSLSSGAHLDTKIRVGGEWVDPQEYMAARGGSGGNVTTLSGDDIRVNAPAQRQAAPQQAPATRSPAPAVAPSNLFAGGSNSLAARIVGVSEGTRTANGGRTQYYGGHRDPGNGVRNMGSFSYQHGANSGEEADQAWNARLEQQMPAYRRAAQAAGMDPNDPRLLFTYLDFYTQSPRAATNFLERLPQLQQGGGLTPDNIANVRTASFEGSFSRNAFGNEAGLRRDQLRRTNAVFSGIQANNLSGGGGAIAQSQSGAPMLPTVAMDSGTLAASGEQIRANAAAAAENAYTTFGSNNRAAVAEVITANQRAQTLIRQSSRTLADTVRQSADEVANVLGEAAPDTSENRYQEALRQLGQQEAQATIELARKIEDSNRSLEQLRLNRQQVQDELARAQQMIAANPALSADMGPAIAEFETTLSQIDGLITESEAAIAALEGSQQQLPLAFMQRRKKLDVDRQREIANEQFAQRSRLVQGSMGISQARIEGMQIRGQETRPMERALAAQQTMFDYRTQVTEIDNLEASMEITAETAAGLRQQLEQLRDVQLGNIAAQAEADRRAMAEERYQEQARVVQGGFGLQEALIAQRQGRGQDTSAMEQEMAIAQQQFDFSAQMREINNLQATMEISAETANTLRSNLAQINEVKLDTIHDQFNVFTSKVLPEIQGATQNLFSGLINGSADLESILDNLISSLANIAAQLLTQELFGSLFGGGNQGGGFLPSLMGGAVGGKDFSGMSGGGGGKGGGWMDIAGMFLNGIIGGFADGGVVGPADHSGYRQGYGEISKALQREGPNGRLAALTPGELVLNNQETRRFFALGLDKVLNFADGGVVPGMTPSPVGAAIAPTSTGSNVNVSVPISNSFSDGKGGDRPPIDSQRLESVIRNVVIREIENQTRYRGVVRR